MTKIQVLIEVDEEGFNNFVSDWVGATAMLRAVSKGKPLPKNHGRLIDEDSIKCDDSENQLIRRETIMRTPTIIERYRGGAEDGKDSACN